MGTSTTAAGITQIGKYVFRNSLPESQAIPVSVKKAVKKYNIKKVALLYGNDDVFTKSGFDTMKKVAEDLKLNIVTIETFQKGQSDYKAQLTKIKGLSPDAVFSTRRERSSSPRPGRWGSRSPSSAGTVSILPRSSRSRRMPRTAWWSPPRGSPTGTTRR
jgi:hypothetical protein